MRYHASAPLMEYREFTPSEPVRSFVERYWTLEIDDETAGVQRVVPDGRAKMIGIHFSPHGAA